MPFKRVDQKSSATNNAAFSALASDSQKEYKALTSWLSKQCTARWKGELEQHQLLLLKRAGINWSPM